MQISALCPELSIEELRGCFERAVSQRTTTTERGGSPQTVLHPELHAEHADDLGLADFLALLESLDEGMLCSIRGALLELSDKSESQLQPQPFKPHALRKSYLIDEGAYPALWKLVPEWRLEREAEWCSALGW